MKRSQGLIRDALERRGTEAANKPKPPKRSAAKKQKGLPLSLLGFQTWNPAAVCRISIAAPPRTVAGVVREKGIFNPHRVASLRSQISQPARKRETHNPSRTRIGDGGEALRRRNHGGSRWSR
ncbi:uncharacterized protein [Gossypium hirsutum]|uniref:Uncharacterized protein n=1 Tax=Gossypium hirsutum TaxID=3635 RepID=A0ABM3A9P2_GOSHI|nr:uncharacterized protein LOC121218453 [Gossypium hirsutum]